jgi:hypothetical protein
MEPSATVALGRTADIPFSGSGTTEEVFQWLPDQLSVMP